jgi:hypothetical protein
MVIGLLWLHSGAREVTAATWPKGPPESRRPTLLGILRDIAIAAPGHRQLGVAAIDGSVRGLVLARARAGGLVWDIEHLQAEDVSMAAELIRWACDRVVRRGARRMFIDTAAEGLGAAAARTAGFQCYTEGVTCRLDAGFARDPKDALPARPRLRSDEIGLFQLYSSAVPANVRSAEAMIHEEWSALYPGRKAWAPTVLGDRQDYVWEMASRAVGWMRVDYGQRSQFLDILIHPLYEAYADKMVRYALVQMSAKVPVLVDVREYQVAARTALERVGFRPGDAYAVWVRQLASRAAEPSLSAVRAPVSPA